MCRSRWNASISSKTLRKPSSGSTSSTRCGKSRSFVRRTNSLLRRMRRVISPNPPPLRASPPRTSRVLQPVGQACPCIGLTQPATVIFWTADLSVTRPRLGLFWSRPAARPSSMTDGLAVCGKPQPVDSTAAGRGAYAIRALPDL
jgi:hypothetical protein